MQSKDNTWVRGLTFAYGGSVSPLFRDFSFEPNSNLVVIEGYSGCGKTTLLRLMAGVLSPQAMTTLPDSKEALLILQEDALFPWLSGIRNIACMIGDGRWGEAPEPLLGELEGLLDRPVYKLSYGQRRLIELARAFIRRPAIMYLDEPFNYLDGLNALRIWERLVALSRDGMRIVLSTHEHRGLRLQEHAEIYRFEGRPPWRCLRELGP